MRVREWLLIMVATALNVAVAMPFAYGQGVTSSISGAVVDQTGGVIPGIEVKARHNSTGVIYTAITVDNGTYTMPAVIPGKYTVTVTALGFKQAVVNNVEAIATAPATVRITLEIGSPSASVVVTGSAEIVPAQSVNIATTIQSRQITGLPLATRNTMDFPVLLPGVSTTRGVRDSTIDGLPTVTNNIPEEGEKMQDNKAGKKGEITFTTDVKIGDLILQPGRYSFQHMSDGADHFVHFVPLSIGARISYRSSPDVKVKAGDVVCSLELLPQKNRDTAVSSNKGDDGRDRVTKIAVAGEDVAHIF